MARYISQAKRQELVRRATVEFHAARHAPCDHKRVIVLGGEETGCRDIRCENCGCRMTRRVENGEYVYDAAVVA